MEKIKQRAEAERAKKAQSGIGRERKNKCKQDVGGRSEVVEGRLKSQVVGGR